jgi:peptidoglycan hydrolase-like protein with peptidoglycan-binding domain
MIYTNAQFRSILNGLGYREELPSDRYYPLSYDESPMTDEITVEAIMAFQAYFNLEVDGIVGPETMHMASVEMETLHIFISAGQFQCCIKRTGGFSYVIGLRRGGFSRFVRDVPATYQRNPSLPHPAIAKNR